VTKTKKPSGSMPVDRRENNRRKTDDRRKQASAIVIERRVGQRREKVSRRRQIDPTTCERDYTDDEVEFMHALDKYKRTSGRMFPTCSEILEVLRDMGYARVNRPSAEASSVQPTQV
jgi:hypothetical protein